MKQSILLTIFNFCFLISYSQDSINSLIENGLKSYYDNGGNLYSSGKYANGKMIGKWIYYEHSLPDTVNYNIVKGFLDAKETLCISNEIYDSTNINEYNQIKRDLANFIRDNIHIPARVRNIKNISEISAIVYIDSTGKIFCPQILNCTNSDIVYEVLRVLFKFKCDKSIQKPIKLSIDNIFYPVSIKDDIDSDPAYVIVEQNPIFQHGDFNTFRMYVQDHLNSIKDNNNVNITGKVIVQFAVNKKGRVVDVKVLRSDNNLLNDEAIRCIRETPLWTPARQGGKLVKWQFVIPVIFK